MTDVVIVVAAVVEHTVLPVEVEALDAGKTGMTGTIDSVASDPTVPVVGDTLGVSTVAAELTPRLPTSKDPNGIPVRATPPGVKAVVDVGVEEEAMLVEPEPHIPDIPEVSTVAAEVDNTPELEAAPDIDVPDEIDVTVVVDVGPNDTPPPSKVEADPNMVDGAVPMVEQSMPLGSIVVVDAPSGLTPGDAISVEPSGI